MYDNLMSKCGCCSIVYGFVFILVIINSFVAIFNLVIIVKVCCWFCFSSELSDFHHIMTMCPGPPSPIRLMGPVPVQLDTSPIGFDTNLGKHLVSFIALLDAIVDQFCWNLLRTRSLLY